MAGSVSNAVRWRLIAIVILLVGGLVLFMANQVTEKIKEKAKQTEVHERPLLAEVNSVIDTLLDQYKIDDKWMRSWSVFTPDKKFVREERRIYVPPRFISLDFNHDLSRALAHMGVRVIATERTRESTVSMHIISKGVIIETLGFVLKRDLE
jgi:hypothetical protein